jgi:hypothetical protein
MHTEILELLRIVNLAQTALWQRLGSFDRRELAISHGHRSTRAWLRTCGRLSGRAAATMIDKAAALEQLPAVGRAAQRGEVSTEHMGKVIGLFKRIGPGAAEAVDQSIAQCIGELTPAELGRVCDAMHPLGEPNRRSRSSSGGPTRRLAVYRSGDLVRLRGDLDLQAGAVLIAALDSMGVPPPAVGPRAVFQRRADALVALARMRLNVSEPATLVGSPGGNRRHREKARSASVSRPTSTRRARRKRRRAQPATRISHRQPAPTTPLGARR